MSTPLAHSSSSTARLMTGALAHQVGWQEPVYLPQPAAGAQWSFKVDGRYFTRVLAIRYLFATSAVVANRFPEVQLVDSNGASITSVPGGSTVAASNFLTAYLTLEAPGFAGGSSGDTFGFLPDLLIPPDWIWKSSVFGMDAGDQFSQIILLVQRFPNDTASQPSGF